jgi:uncharacterized membrane protein YfcA
MQGVIGAVSLASDWNPGLSRTVASFYPSFLTNAFVERLRLPLLLGLSVGGFILFSLAVAPTAGRLAIFVGIFIAAAVSGVSGLAFPLIAGPIFLLIYPAPEAVALTAMCSLTGQLFSIALLWQAIGYQYRVPLIAAGLLGVPLGSALLCSCNSHAVHIVFGALIVVSGAWRSLRIEAKPTRRPSLLSEALVGLVGGFTGGLVGASSVVPAIWCAASGLDKSHQRSVTQPYILTMQAASLGSLWACGAVDRTLLGQYADFALPVLVGVGLGVAGFRALSSSAATRVIMGVVTASGLSLLFL